jgi:DNA polymerase-3 subunit beta
MEVVCERNRLRQALGLVTHVVPSKTTKPILQHVRLLARAGDLTIEGTDLEVAARGRVEGVKVRSEGGCTILGRTFSDFVRDGESEEVSMRLEGTNLAVVSGRDSGTMPTGDIDEFPTIPHFGEGEILEIPGISWSRMVGRTSFAAAREAGRYSIHGVLVEVGGEQLRVVATDGRRLAFTFVPLPKGPSDRRAAIVPIRGVEQFRRAVEAMADPTAPVSLSLGEREVAMRAESTEVFSRVLEGEFPRYEGVIPKDPPNAAELDRQVFLQRLRCVANFTSEEARAVQLEFAEGVVRFSAKSAGRGEGRSEMEAVFRGKPGEVAFNPDYLRDAVEAAGGGEESSTFRFEFNDRSSPGKLLFGEDFCYVVMPIAHES